MAAGTTPTERVLFSGRPSSMPWGGSRAHESRRHAPPGTRLRPATDLRAARRAPTFAPALRNRGERPLPAARAWRELVEAPSTSEFGLGRLTITNTGTLGPGKG